MTTRLARRAFATLVLTLATTSLAHAQATRTWVSGVGDDANPCSRTAPCKTFAGAISKTAAGGEISVLDPGGYGAVTITKSMTLSGDGSLASILAAGTNGVTISAGTGDVVIRNISLIGAGSGLSAIKLLSAASLTVDHVSIGSFTAAGIDIDVTAPTNVVVTETSIQGGTAGVLVNGTTGRVEVSLDRVSIRGAVTGVDAVYGNTAVVNSVIAQNSTFGVLAEGGTLTVEGSMLTGNGTALQAQTGATLRISNNGVYNNLTGFGCGGGTLASAGNNRKGGNVGGGAPVCSPNATVVVQ